MDLGGNTTNRSGALAQAVAARGRWGLAHSRAGWSPLALFAQAWAVEVEERRLFLWLPVAAGAGVLLYLNADTEPVLWLPALLLTGFAISAFLQRHRRFGFSASLLLAFVAFGFLCGELRTARVDAPVLDRIRIVHLEGRVESIDNRRVGARFELRVETAIDSNGAVLPAAITPLHVRLSMKKPPNFAAGDNVHILARLLPPARASIPGGYDFARTAFFSGLGAVGSLLGSVEALPAATPPTLMQRFFHSLDRQRNVLAERVDTIIGGDEGAIAAAMVTGKRNLLSDDALELIREAGIFHIITISGVQMTLVAGMIFWGTRRLLSLSDQLALHYPIKKIAALVAIAAAIFYDLATGSRVGTERALYMTLIMLGAILFDRQGFTMRNLAYAALSVIIMEPEAITGASFQLSFSAVAALIAVHEARISRHEPADLPVGMSAPTRPPPVKAEQAGRVYALLDKARHHIWHLLISTIFATSATASFMASDFHDLSPYVLIGNPLTLAIIEFFAVPGALIGTLLYPLGLDTWVWSYVGLGIKIVLWAAKIIGSAPGSTVHLHAFAPWTLPFLALAVLNGVIWRTWIMRLAVLPCLALGLLGVWQGAHFDFVVPPTGDFLAFRAADGRLAVLGKRPSPFASEQFLAADADGRLPLDARSTTQICDKLGCVDQLPSGAAVSVVLDSQAFEEDCSRALIIVSPLEAPPSCHARLIFDRKKLSQTGAIALVYPVNADTLPVLTTERGLLTNRPWSKLPKPDWIAPEPKPAKFNPQPRPLALVASTPEDDSTADAILNENVDGAMSDGLP